ncbi:hypothetical protein UA08_05609 [Talaromyces atroroseus]|uniref:Uncharacterized protein n=1 Tax=Talaromyces atroroseus TaxID=1441469 RepID=A0A225AVZ8_TALAT|nr:hypothetical protein UA08_05609 [Talaromyces atroroseus]OKL59136.1 hypothetical protein UA08_05609 [Talaromyces atroroseus]
MAQKLPQLTNSTTSKSLRDHERQTGNSTRNSKSWLEWMRSLTRGNAPAEGIERTTSRATSIAGVGLGTRRKKTSDEGVFHKKERSFSVKYESQSSGEEDSVRHLQRTQTHRHKRSEGENNRAANNYHHQQPPFDFQLPDSSPAYEHEAERALADTRQPPMNTSDIHEDRQDHNHNNHHEHGHEHEQHLHPSSPSSKFDNSYHHLNDCPFYTSEVSNLKIRIIELEYINATLENKVHKYRDEIRLFKKDIKGYKSDARQFTQLLKERETEIEVLHKKITQLLNQDTQPLSPLSTLGSSSKRSNGSSNSSRKRYSGSTSSPAKDRFSGKYYRTLEHIDETPSEHETQWWI